MPSTLLLPDAEESDTPKAGQHREEPAAKGSSQAVVVINPVLRDGIIALGWGGFTVKPHYFIVLVEEGCAEESGHGCGG
jgi:hypothetical protein